MIIYFWCKVEQVMGLPLLFENQLSIAAKQL